MISTTRDWDTIKHFKREEFRNDPERVSWDVVMLMDQMREDAGVGINIHVAWDDSGHVADSSHYTDSREYSSAVDFNFVGWSLLDQWLFAERYPWSGIGIYPYWRTPGLHVDLRRLGRDHPTMGKRWWRDAAGLYLPLDRRCVSLMMLTHGKGATDAAPT